MATATKRRKAKQRTIDGDDGKPVNDADLDRIPEIEDLGDQLEELRAERASLGSQCKEVVHQLSELMKKHKRRVYKYGNGKELLLTEDHKEEVKIKRKKPKDEADDGRDFGGE